MKALRVHGGKAEVRDIPEPEPNGEPVVRVLLSGICNTDLEIARGYAGFEGTIGHEFVGIVENAGGGAIAIGERVVGEINAGCGTCSLCISGDPRHCATRTVLGIVGRDGAHAERLRLPARNLLRVPTGVSDVAAVFVEPLAAACGILERAPIPDGARVAVIGDGKLGLLCAQVLAAAGKAPIVIGKHDDKLELARARVIETMLASNAHSFLRSFDFVVEASGAREGFDLAVDLLVPRGTLVLKSTFAGATAIDAARLVVDEIRVVGSRCGRFAPAIELLEKGAVDVDALVSDTIALAEGESAMRRAAERGVLKVLLAR